MKKKKIFHWLSSSQGGVLLIRAGGQSELGNAGGTGRVDFANMPAYLKNPYSNVFIYDRVMGGPNTGFEAYIPSASFQMGFIDQVIHEASLIFSKVYVEITAVGGTQIVEDGVGDSYPKDNFFARSLAAKAILDDLYGENNYSEFVIWAEGETAGADETRSLAHEAALEDMIDRDRSEVGDYDWFVVTLSETKYDFQFRDNINTGITNLAGSMTRVNAVSGSGLRTAAMVSGTDFSHYFNASDIALGSRVVASAFPVIGKSKRYTTAPSLLSSSISTNGLVVTMTYDGPLNEGVIPFWRQWTIGTKCFIPSISGNTLTLTCLSPFRSGESVTVNYTKNVAFSENIMDNHGNEVADLVNVAVTNNSTVPNPTLTLIKAFDFSLSMDGWSAGGGGSVAFNQTIGGETACATYTSGGATGQFYNSASGMVGGGSNTYRTPMRVYLPLATFYNLNPTIKLQLFNTPTVVVADLRSFIKPDTWMDLEVQFLNTGANDDLYFQMTNIAASDVLGWKGISIYRVT